MRNTFAACLLVFVLATTCPSDDGSSSLRLKSMQQRLERRQAIVNGWGSEARQQIFFSVAIGMLGLVVGLLQASRKPWAKGLTVGVGFCVSAITLFTNKIYTADYRTLQKSVIEATPIIEDLQAILLTFEPTQSVENQKATEVEFVTKCGKIDLIVQRLQDLGTPSSDSANKSARMFQLEIVYAQPQQAQQTTTASQPSWTYKNVQTDGKSTFFVGVFESRSLSAAKGASLDVAAHVAAHWIRGDAQVDEKSEVSPQLVELAKHTVDVDDTWFSYDRTSGLYRYFTRLRMSNDVQGIGLSGKVSDEVKATLPLSIKLSNDSATRVADTGLMLLVKHMGVIPLSADLYVLSGAANPGQGIEPYSGDRVAADRYVAKFKSLLGSCDGSHTNDGSYTIWCYHIDSSLIKRSKHKAQHLGVVSSKGYRFDLFAADFDYKARSIEVEVRGVARVLGP